MPDAPFSEESNWRTPIRLLGKHEPIIKRYLSFTICRILVFTRFMGQSLAMSAIISCTGLSASANSTVETDVPSVVLRSAGNGGISTLATDPPNHVSGGETSLPYTAEPYPIYAGSSCYTAHYFKTSTGTLTLNYHLNAVQPATGYRSFTFELYKGSDGFLWNVNWSKVDSVSDSIYDTDDEDTTHKPAKKYDGEVTFSNLDTNAIYCIRIKNTSVASTSSTVKNAICGTIDIDD